jgi:hypothetical protein
MPLYMFGNGYVQKGNRSNRIRGNDHPTDGPRNCLAMSHNNSTVSLFGKIHQSSFVWESFFTTMEYLGTPLSVNSASEFRNFCHEDSDLMPFTFPSFLDCKEKLDRSFSFFWQVFFTCESFDSEGGSVKLMIFEP